MDVVRKPGPEVEEKSQPHHDVKLILLRNVDDYGVKGQVGYNPS